MIDIAGFKRMTFGLFGMFSEYRNDMRHGKFPDELRN